MSHHVKLVTHECAVTRAASPYRLNYIKTPSHAYTIKGVSRLGL